MPYLKQEYRSRLDSHIKALANEMKKIAKEGGETHSFAGLLDYSFTKLILQTMPEQRYWAYTLVDGMLSGLSKEFNRRIVVGPFEETQKEQRGDIYQ
ncbi:hypothetical protein COU91_01585 [Candidatus Saccharibacteria bacterium CG10_big_fil_rev_8_21_14_0_10_47_8]|nr:MAG: hypothetical protein COU91_01585 [Candidatus Saccharibacteria bacterium CG10_big_fil_rev_8_21_14_0_10_47_8]